MSPRLRVAILAAIFGLILAGRLVQLRIVWAEEAYPAAAAQQLLRGKVLYRDVWFDKPPLYAAAYLLWGARTGLPMRLGGALFLALIAGLGYRFALEAWGRDEALAAACLLGVYLTFGIPSAVMALAPDLLMLVPHLAAVWLAWRGNAFAGGLAAGVALLFNPKGALVLLVCLLWQWRRTHRVIAGFLLPNLILYGYLALNGAWTDYVREVWEWGALYARDTFVRNPLREALVRTANWTGFHAAAAIAAAWFLWSERASRPWRFALWILIAFAGVFAGWRFFPRYYFLPLAPVCMLAARGLMRMPKAARIAALSLLLIPAIRFGTRYVVLARDLAAGRPHQWSDLAMNDDSRAAGELLRDMAKPGDTLLVWGYRADIFASSGLAAGTRFLDSQPLTGVLADRHLANSVPTAPDWAVRNRRELAGTKPGWIVDGLGPYNHALAIDRYADLAPWLAGYEVKARTADSIIYRRRLISAAEAPNPPTPATPSSAR